MTAAKAMMGIGYDIYFPINGAVKTDFVAIRDDEVCRCQVKTAYWGSTGEYTYLCTRTGQKKYGNKAFDYLLVVGPEEEVWRIPWAEVGEMQTLYFNRFSTAGRKYDPSAWLLTPPPPKARKEKPRKPSH